ncbi:MAG: MgtC/SapB family protein [Patescibacteria group bacterium]|nr:MgtC/SapB family protein [Patescibacteria group bacterium]
MLSLFQIILRLILSLIFGGLIFWLHQKKEKVVDVKIYPLISLGATCLALFSLKIFFNLYSKIDLAFLPAVLILGIFLCGRILRKEGLGKEVITSLVLLLLTSLIGLMIGFGFYELAIFSTLFFLIFSFLSRHLKL